MKYIYTTSSESYIYIFTVFNGILFFSTFFFGNTQVSDLHVYEKTPPMSPRRVARDVIETLDTDGKLIFYFFNISQEIYFTSSTS